MPTAPKGGKQPQTKKPVPAQKRATKMAKGAPTKGSGSDTNPFSSARASLKGGKK
jgi:hypothetical protein